MLSYRFELITGPMSCGKTEELLRRLNRAKIAGKKIKVFSPVIDTRAFNNHIESRNGTIHSAIKVKNSSEIFNFIDNDDEVIGIDELQFFDENITTIISDIIKMGKKVIGTGLELDFKSEPFGAMPILFCYADKIDKLTAICMKCGSEYGSRTQRIIDGEPAHRSSPLIMVGGDERYEARCLNCYEINDDSEKLASLVSSVTRT
ncbi:MAG: thymidine kinase [Candidatus Gastranaerophilales bacterium]|nr:thymidine kinase [Candidatus Gastranaerophilales bacterium]